ncbi:hypothetical protein pRL70006 (plasmid) [Rhizobium johnstonii 3841]|uniref:Uncharacterized protein n=1 Tax=Rhizobium johnstonii (strain DSM 114642 / LMG 32736 / 3841) TaxID=216596 RepID=Q1MA09_RHIJ3|nr:hypothetical protein pRL70006 [Rhizobium johnstonii 3841]
MSVDRDGALARAFDRQEMNADEAYTRAFERQRPKQSIGCGNSEKHRRAADLPSAILPTRRLAIPPSTDAERASRPFERRSACRRESCSRIASGTDCRGCANGSVLYLAEDRRSTSGVPGRAFCFVNTKGKDRKVEAGIFCAWP